jgi:hypothetical protein
MKMITATSVEVSTRYSVRHRDVVLSQSRAGNNSAFEECSLLGCYAVWLL